jgi:lipoprotein NlpI
MNHEGHEGSEKISLASFVVFVLFVFFVVPLAGAQAPGEGAQTIFDRAIRDFEAGRIAESAAGFDRVAALSPSDAPGLWQRGIALYYKGRYADCRAQFESHRLVNPDDVENAAWHFLCVARAESFDKARAALLPVGPDSRVPMAQIYAMFRGRLRPDEVVAAAGARPAAVFYAHLYVGLYEEARGEERAAAGHIRIAAEDRFKAEGGYMHMVARVHLAVRKWGKP